MTTPDPWNPSPVASGAFLSQLQERVANARNSARSSRSGDAPSLPMAGREVGDSATCPNCGDTVVLKATMPNAQGRSIKYWSDCRCLDGFYKRSDELVRQSDQFQSATRGAGTLRNDLRIVEQFEFSDFDLDFVDPIQHGSATIPVVAFVQRWTEAIKATSHSASYHDKLPTALYFYSAGPGRGKTHLASAAATAIHRLGKVAAFANETDFLDRFWAASFEERDALKALVADRAWLAVIDDIGMRENPSPGVRNAWYEILNRRWLKKGWTIFTSNLTPAELLERGTLNQAAFDRMFQMTQGVIIPFNSRGSYRQLRPGRAQ